MISHKKFFLSIALLSGSLLSTAQSLQTKKENNRIKGITMEGVAVEIDQSNFKDVDAALIKFMKSYGKLKQTADYTTLQAATLNGKPYALPIYIAVKESAALQQPWLGIEKSEWTEEDATQVMKELEKIIVEFGVQFKRDKIQVQIDESNQALQAVEKQQQRFVNQKRELATKLEDNKREKIQLEKSITNNKLEYETLLKRIDKNQKDQDSLGIASDQIKKVIDSQKLKQQKVN